MKARLIFALAAAALIFMAAPLTSTNLNSSKSNSDREGAGLYRLTYPTDLVTPDQVKALLAELDKLGPVDEEVLKKWLSANFGRFGIVGDRVKKLVILPRGGELKEVAIILLTSPEDEAAAIAATVKGSKSNSPE